MAAESNLQGRMTRYLRRRGWLVCKIILCSQDGWPDLYALKKLNGEAHHVWIEVKAPGKIPSPLQAHIHQQLRRRKGIVLVISDYKQFAKYFKKVDPNDSRTNSMH